MSTQAANPVTRRLALPAKPGTAAARSWIRRRALSLAGSSRIRSEPMQQEQTADQQVRLEKFRPEWAQTFIIGLFLAGLVTNTFEGINENAATATFQCGENFSVQIPLTEADAYISFIPAAFILDGNRAAPLRQ